MQIPRLVFLENKEVTEAAICHWFLTDSYTGPNYESEGRIPWQWSGGKK